MCIIFTSTTVDNSSLKNDDEKIKNIQKEIDS